MEIIAVCGSVKFKEEMLEYRDDQMSNGKWILLPENMDIDIQMIDKRVKRQMDRLHLRKIDCADKVLVWNRGGYIGESTQKEIKYARTHNKDVEFIEYAEAREVRNEMEKQKTICAVCGMELHKDMNAECFEDIFGEETWKDQNGMTGLNEPAHRHLSKKED